MHDKQLTAGLNLLADEYSEQLDIDAVIDAERSRGRHRRSVAAVTLAIVVLLTAMSAVTITMNLDQRDQAARQTPTDGPTQTSPPRSVINGKLAENRAVDDQSRKLTDQLAAAKATLLPNLQIDPDPRNTDNIQEGTPPALEFGRLTIDDGSEESLRLPHYEAFAKLTDQQGFATIRISVSGADTAGPDGCLAGRSDCTSRQLPDGTNASWHTHIGDAMGWNQRVEARRPDGTLIFVSISVWNGVLDGDRPTRPEVPLTQDQLYKFATVFNY